MSGRARGGHGHTSYGPTPQQLAREAARVERERKQAATEAESHRRALRTAEAQDATDALDARVHELSTLLARGLDRSAALDLDGRSRRLAESPIDLGTDGAPGPPPQWESFAPRSPTFIGRLFGGSAHSERVRQAEAAFATAQADHGHEEAARQVRVSQRRQVHAEAVATAQAEIAEYQAGIAARDRVPVERYASEVLANLPLLTDFPREAEVTFDAGEDHAVVRVQLPTPEVVPAERSFSYVRPPRDETVAKPRPAKERAALYRTVVAQVALLVLRDLFDADAALQKISLNCHVRTTNRATGSAENPCLVSLVVDRVELERLVLDQVEPVECLRHLRALVSPHPYDVEPVRPLVDFDRSRYAFTEGIDVVAGLDSRDDLMTLTPTEFEHLVRQLFEALPGMQGWTTQASGDEGVDAVIFNDTPITGGFTVVQAKRYKAAVGVAHVRELAGAMEDKKAGRGVLVTTSTFTKGALELADRLQRIQLIDRHHLVHLLKETLDKDVVIGDGSRRVR